MLSQEWEETPVFFLKQKVTYGFPRAARALCFVTGFVLSINYSSFSINLFLFKKEKRKMTTTTQIPSFKTQKYDRQLRFVSIKTLFFFFCLFEWNELSRKKKKKSICIFHLYKAFLIKFIRNCYY